MNPQPPLNVRAVWCRDTLQTCRDICKPTVDITCNQGTLNYTCPCDISTQPKTVNIYMCSYATDVCNSNCVKNDTVCKNFCESKRCIPQVVQTVSPNNGTQVINFDAASCPLSLALVLLVILQINI